jgi:hypothetical protein
MQNIHDVRDEHRVNVRLPKWLHEELVQSAVTSGWDVSKQIRFELASLRGKAQAPTLPNAKARRVA